MATYDALRNRSGVPAGFFRRLLLLAMMGSAGCVSGGSDRLSGAALRLDSPKTTCDTFLESIRRDGDLPRAYACLCSEMQASCGYCADFRPALTRRPEGLLLRKLLSESQYVAAFTDREHGTALVQVMIRDTGVSLDLVYEKIAPRRGDDPGVLPGSGWRLRTDLQRLISTLSGRIRPEERTPGSLGELRASFSGTVESPPAAH